jgi:hypothetical protein
MRQTVGTRTQQTKNGPVQRLTRQAENVGPKGPEQCSRPQ